MDTENNGFPQQPSQPERPAEPRVTAWPQPQPGQAAPPPAPSAVPTPAPSYPATAPAQPLPQSVGAQSEPFQPSAAPAATENPGKNYLLAVAFSYLFGGLGIDRFYLGYIGTGMLKLITLGGLGIWHLVDLLLITFGKRREKSNPAPLEGFGKYFKTMKMVAIVLIVINVVIITGFLISVVVFGVLGSHQRAAQGAAQQENYPPHSFQPGQAAGGAPTVYNN